MRKQDIQAPTVHKEATVPKAMEAGTRRATDRRASIWMIGGEGVWGSWRRFWRVWRAVVVWIVCCFRRTSGSADGFVGGEEMRWCAVGRWAQRVKGEGWRECVKVQNEQDRAVY